MAGVSAYVLTFALDATAWLNDEYGTVIAGRQMARDPGEIVSATAAGLARGPERLTSVLLALPDALFSGAPAGLRASHVLLVVVYTSVAVPAYALLRGLDVPRWPAAALAAAAIAGPWMVFGTTLLNITVAAPLTIAFVWAAWRAVVRPTLPAEALAVGLAALMTTARVSHAAFYAAAVAAALAAAWWSRTPGAPLSRFPAAVLRRNPLIVGVALAGAAVGAVVGPRALAGGSYDRAVELTFTLALGDVWQALGWYTAVLALGTGFVALPLGGAWALRQLVRPSDVRTGVFAVLAVVIFLVAVWIAGAAEAQ